VVRVTIADSVFHAAPDFAVVGRAMDCRSANGREKRLDLLGDLLAKS
jgi:hypothetical protein